MKSSNICLALAAHVDAGKTTLSESILLHTGVIRKAGRVDHGDSFFDHAAEERERGITIFSKQAEYDLGEKHFTLMDTPGHVDFSAEMERTLSVLDYAVLIISAPDGVHGHDITLWKLFETYQIPFFVFVNKMDQPGADKDGILEELKSRFGEGFVDFTDLGGREAASAASEHVLEQIAVLDDELTESFLMSGELPPEKIQSLIRERKLFPCCFGSALKDTGIDHFLKVIEEYTEESEMPDSFSARIYKISRDSRGNRLTHVRLLGGQLKTKETVRVFAPGAAGTAKEEKVDQILLYSGEHFEQLQEAEAGMVVALKGLAESRTGGSLGQPLSGGHPLMVPLFSSRIVPEDDMDMHRLYMICRELEEEIPEIRIDFKPSLNELRCQLMGAVQTDVLQEILHNRFNADVRFEPASVVYRETITAPVYCTGHYEPLKHYAEVHLVLEPLERGSGMEYVSSLSEDVLPRNFQRLILTNAAEKKHTGVLTGGELTDVRIRLVNAKAHEKHTEGGDFRQAVYRAIRQGLMKSREGGTCQLLEPYYDFELRVPTASAGRAMTDLSRIAESFTGPQTEGGESVFRGRAAVTAMHGYGEAVLSYTGGFGRLHCVFGGYGDCKDPDPAIREAAYDPELDADNPSGSVFCSHGAGYYVPWYEADSMMHLPPARYEGMTGAYAKPDGAAAFEDPAAAGPGSRKHNALQGTVRDYLGAGLAADRELEAIFNRTLSGNRKAGKQDDPRRNRPDLMRNREKSSTVAVPDPLQSYLLVDGYNIIFSWDELKELAKVNVDAARTALADILANYQGYRGMTLILVFDAYKVRGGLGSVEQYHNIHIVYTKEAQTADAYIEAAVHEIAKNHRVTVATSDGLEQTIVFGEGAYRMSARELKQDVESCSRDIYEQFIARKTALGNRLQLEEPEPAAEE